jgi:hypothetical protein
VAFTPTAGVDEIPRVDCGCDVGVAGVAGGTDGDAVADKVGWKLGRAAGPQPSLPAPSSAAVDEGPSLEESYRMSENPYAIPVEELVASAQVAPEAQIEVQTEHRAVAPDWANPVNEVFSPRTAVE